MNPIKLLTNFFKQGTNSSSSQNSALKLIKKMMNLKMRITVVITIVTFFFFLVLLSTALSYLGYNVEMMGLFGDTSNTTSSVGVDLNFDFEEYSRLSDAAVESSGSPSADLNPTQIKGVSNFNQHVSDTVNQAGFGTRQGVVAAGVSMIGDYIKYSGKRIKYDQATRQASTSVGIANADYLAMDCSGFVFWTLYNGGYNIPSDLAYVQTDRIYEWSNSRGFSKDVNSGQAGDFLVTRGKGHIVLIVGVDSDGYWCAEEAGWGYGGVIKKRYFSSLGSYVLVDMTNYYSNSSNVRSA